MARPGRLSELSDRKETMLRKTSLVLLLVAAVHIVVGGAELAAQDELLHQASLQRDNLGTWNHFCSGFIVSDSHLVTAARCVVSQGVTTTTFRVQVGTHNLLLGGVIHQVSDIIPHPLYDSSKPGMNDVALIKVDHPFLMDGNTVAVASLPSSGASFPYGNPATLAGWGEKQYLQKTEVMLLGQSLCEPYNLGLLDFSSNSLSCAAGVKQQVGSCNSENGSPVSFGNTVVGYVVGLKNCEELPSAVLVEGLSTHVSWIYEHTNI